MQPGRIQQPFISEQIVRDALDSLVRLTRKEGSVSPLQFLILIDLQLSDPAFPQTSFARQFALQKLLTQMISDQYVHHLKMFDPEASTAEELSHLNVYVSGDQIASDVKRAIPELIGWSFLFYHYVRVDLGVSLQVYCTMGDLEEHSLRRYQQRSIQRLTELLITEEWAVRKQHFARFLTSLIPYPESTILFGRADALNFLRQQIGERGKHHLLISGASGIGKTLVISSFLNEVIQQNKVDKLIWINSPLSIEGVNQHLSENLPENQNLSLSKFFSMWRTFIVLDDIEWLQNEEQELIEFLKDFSNVVVLMTSSRVTLSPELMHYSLKELNHEAITSIIQSEYTTGSIQEIMQHASRVWGLAGGNPLAAKIVSRHLQFFGYTSSTSTVFGLDALYNRVYEALEPEIQQTWLAMAILPAHFVNIAEITPLIELFTNPDLIRVLSINHLVEMRNEAGLIAYKLPTSAYQFIGTLYRTDNQVKAFLDGEIANIVNSHAMPIEIIESILTSSWLEISALYRHHLIDSYYRAGINARHFATWASLLQLYEASTSSANIHLTIGYGEALYRLNKWREAKVVFEKGIELSGKYGLFDIQTNAIIGLVKIMHSQGDYARALGLLQRINTLPSAHQYKLAILTVRIQIELEAEEIDRAGELIANFELEELPFLLRAEYFLRSGQYSMLSEYSSKLLQESIDRGSLAKLHVLLGNSSEQQGDYEAAHNHFFIALTILEQDSVDEYAIARVKTNLGAILLHQGYWDHARLLLETAQEMQMRLQDRVGLATTRHNLQLLNTNFIS